MQFTKEFSEFEPWSGAVETMDKIQDAGKLDDLESFLEEYFNEEIPSETEINDLLWFQGEWVLEQLDIDVNDEEEAEDELEEDENEDDYDI